MVNECLTLSGLFGCVFVVSALGEDVTFMSLIATVFFMVCAVFALGKGDTK